MAEAASVDVAPADLSAALLSAVRRGEPTERIEAAIESLSPGRLEDSADAARRAFWIDLYNAVTQLLLAEALGSRPKGALGYLRNPFAGSVERRLRVYASRTRQARRGPVAPTPADQIRTTGDGSAH